MSSYAYYRLPRTDRYVALFQEQSSPLELSSVEQLDGKQGFVIAPFVCDEACPILLLQPDREESGHISMLCDESRGRADYHLSQGLHSQMEASLPVDRHYEEDFLQFHQQLADGRFQKLVLARRAVEERREESNPLVLFQKACTLYPHSFISLVSTPQSGTWLMATPEILLEQTGSQWRTIALAGTMDMRTEQERGESGDAAQSSLGGQEAAPAVSWSDKNIREQRYVASYIKERLCRFTHLIKEEGPRTVRAAHLAHLRSDFTFALEGQERLGSLIEALHPTPAVCGLPKQEAMNFILSHEHSPRKYYSGFVGPLLYRGATHLYVSLRCMQIHPTRYELYAGGGLLKESQLLQEWTETEAKMQTMRRLIMP